jgi:hypothetical protein
MGHVSYHNIYWIFHSFVNWSSLCDFKLNSLSIFSIFSLVKKCWNISHIKCIKFSISTLCDFPVIFWLEIHYKFQHLFFWEKDAEIFHTKNILNSVPLTLQCQKDIKNQHLWLYSIKLIINFQQVKKCWKSFMHKTTEIQHFCVFPCDFH